MSAAIPVTTVGGYLGAGKTTLVNRLLAGGHGLRIGVLVNDFGAVSIDERLIVARDGDVVSLANGCACCSVAGDLAEALDRFGAGPVRYDQIVIEASGVADPARIAALAGSPGLRRGATVVVADAGSIRERALDKFVGRLVRRQLAAADLVVLSRIDLADDAVRDSARTFVMREAPNARLVEAAHGAVPAAVLFVDGSVAASTAARPAAGSLVCMPADMPADLPAASDLFESHVWTSRRAVDAEALRAVVAGLPPDVARVKGIVGGAHGVVVQRAGTAVDVRPLDGPASAPGAEIAAEIVVIARRGALDRHDLDRAFAACVVAAGDAP